MERRFVPFRPGQTRPASDYQGALGVAEGRGTSQGGRGTAAAPSARPIRFKGSSLPVAGGLLGVSLGLVALALSPFVFLSPPSHLKGVCWGVRRARDGLSASLCHPPARPLSLLQLFNVV